ncbi:heavy-metal-associated domain-containing protein [Staphylococcus chromogenes]|uniref:heavy-metal-associated domain-containing protein n=1 Tax=Staphylococcus chromogenes TaxID=46126 RepID=UPI000E6A0B69|nr:cation transporter [Staphylococcus chromogenes]RIM14880.1 copper chaperone [Staphylococcus chromogenes]
MAKHTINVEGMTCNHCKEAVESAVKENKEVLSVVATPDEGHVIVELMDDGALHDVKQCIYDAGYEVK